MPKLVPVSAKKMIKILQISGFVLIRVRGSHHFFLNQMTGNTTVVPVHSGEVLGVGLLKAILRDIEMSVQKYDLLRRKI